MALFGAKHMIRPMDARWFRDRLKQLGKTQAQMARHLGLPPPRVVDILNESRKVSAIEAADIADFLDVPLNLLVNKLGSAYKQDTTRTIPVVGYVGAGEMIVAFDDHALGDGLREIEAPPGADGDFAVEVRGHSMHPRFRDGDCLVYDRERGTNTDDCIGRECVVALASGELVVKLCEKGSRKGTLTLISINTQTPAMQNVAIQWAAPITWIRPRR